MRVMRKRRMSLLGREIWPGTFVNLLDTATAAIATYR